MTQKPPSRPPAVKMNFSLPLQGSAWGMKPAAAPRTDPAQLTALFAQGRFRDVEAGALALTSREPQSGTAWKILSAALLAQNKPALEAARKAAGLLPQDAEAACNLGHALHDLARVQEAADEYRRAVGLQPTLLQAWLNLGSALRELQRTDEAIEAFKQVLRLAPTSPEAYNHLGMCQGDKSQHEAALGSFKRALDLNPRFEPAAINIGRTLMAMDRIELAASAFDRALAMNPTSLEALRSQAEALSKLGHFTQAHQHLTRALTLDPGDAPTRASLGSVLGKLGRIQDSIDTYRAVLAQQPDLLEVIPNLVFMLHYLAEPPQQEITGLSWRYGQQIEAQVPRLQRWANTPEPARRLRVGLVSPDFRNHPVGHFLESVLAALTQKHGDGLELHAYFCDKREDLVTQRLKPLFAHWHAAAGWSPARLSEQVQADAIDILIDLAGYTENHRLLTFAAKPAPVQASWLGYFATTGLRQIDHLIGDELTLLPSEEASYTEHVWRLPRTRLCFTPPRAEVTVRALPALTNGHITFGCFNTLNKVNGAVIQTWSRILLALPGSRLVIKNREVEQAANAAALTARFASHGVSAGQLHFQHSSAREAYLDSYNGIDIALDPFPYPGGTTTAESLWMGVPVLTLAGQTMLSRQGLGLLVNAGLPDWVAHSTDEYVNKAVAFASNLDALARLRQGLRAQVLASPVFDADRFADDLNGALRGMWQRWCGSQQASATAMP